MNRTPRSVRFPRTSRAGEENNPGFMRAAFAAFATTMFVLGGLGLAAPAAHAQGPCPGGKSCMTWCPGDPNPAGRPVPWDGSVCHDYYWDYSGVHDIGTGAFYSWRDMPWG